MFLLLHRSGGIAGHYKWYVRKVLRKSTTYTQKKWSFTEIFAWFLETNHYWQPKSLGLVSQKIERLPVLKYMHQRKGHKDFGLRIHEQTGNLTEKSNFFRRKNYVAEMNLQLLRRSFCENSLGKTKRL